MKSKQLNFKRKKAFALLMSLFMMGFLVVLVVTLSSIVQLQLRSTRQNILDQKAKNAARLAAFQALGEIQKSLGPDQRITANAAILDTELNPVFDELQEDDSYAFWDYNPLFDRDDVNLIDGIANPHWLGVWDSTPGYHPMPRLAEDDRTFTSERFVAYANNFLVSGNHTIKRETSLPSSDELLLTYSPIDELEENYINMLRKNSITDEKGEYDSDTMQVRVPLVTIPVTEEMSARSFLETRIAWYVTDESQKADLNVLASEDEFSEMEKDGDKLTQLQSLPYKNGIQALIIPDTTTALFDLDLNDEDDRNLIRALGDVTQIDSLQVSSFTSSAAKMLYNSITLNTRGLPVNVRNGGLKKDLTVGLLSLSPSSLDSDPQYFERPIGVEGYDAYLTNPTTSGVLQPNVFTSNSSYSDKKGHMFGPQAAENINLSYTGLNYAKNTAATDDVATVHEDPGGPLWDSLREYYNNRVLRDGTDAQTGATSGYANKLKTKTDVTTGLSPVLLHYQLFVMPTLANYGGSKYGVRIYFVPIVVLWNPYDIPIAENSTYAFRHGAGTPCLLGNMRVAVGVKNGNLFECIRDIRAESMPRPFPNVEGSTVYTTMGGAAVSGQMNFASVYGRSAEDINFYRAVSFSNESVGIISATAAGTDGSVKSGNGTEYSVNKSYFGYGNWRYTDTQSLVSGVEDDDYFPTSTDNSLKDLGLVRIYNEGTHSNTSKTLGGVSITLPKYYYLSTESFFYRKLYLNNLLYSIAWTGQCTLKDGGTTNSLSLSNVRTNIFSGSTDATLRFLVRNEEALEAGSARIFSLKESIPYHYYFGSSATERGYAGDFALAEENAWYLTEGLDKESIGGFFVDIMHAERTHLASTENSYGTGRNPSYSASNLRNVELNPQVKCRYDGLELGVLFDLGDGRNYAYSDDSNDTLNDSIDVDDIFIDIDKWNLNPASTERRCFVTPWYMKAEAAFNPNPWRSVSSSIPSGSHDLNKSRISIRAAGGGDGYTLNHLVMWNYNDSPADSTLLYYDGDTTTNSIGSTFQSLKRYSLLRSNQTSPILTQSFPEPLRIYDDWQAGGTYAWTSYFQILNSMCAFYGNTYGTTSQGKDASASSENPSFEEQGIFVGSKNTDVNANYTHNAATQTLLTMTGIRDKVRGMNKPILGTQGSTIYDTYYKNLLIEVDTLISGKGGTPYSGATSISDISDAAYENFLNDLDLYDKYDAKSWVLEDTYFLLRNPRRVATPRWPTDGLTSTNTGDQYYLWRDNFPKAVSPVVVDAYDTEGLKLTDIQKKDDGSIAFFEGISSYRPISNDIADSYPQEYPFQYPFQFPWLSQTNVSAKVFGNTYWGNAGSTRDRSYGTNATSGILRFYAFGGYANNLQFTMFQAKGEEGTDGNFRLREWFSYLIDKFNDDEASDGEAFTQVQIGPDVLSGDTYRYTLKRYLRDYEIVTNPVDLATADLAFGADLNRSLGYGTGTADMYYPNNLMGSSLAHMRIAPERPYDYLWVDGHTNANGDLTASDDGVRDDSDIEHVSYDMVWMMNDIFWDEYFFSTIPYRSIERNEIDDYYEYLVPKNPRLEYVNKNKDKIYTRIDDSITSIDNFVEDTDNLDEDFDSNSARLWIKGAFNVNSTNVDAWKIILATSFGNDIYALDGTSSSNEDRAPFPRNGMPYTASLFDEDMVKSNEKLAMQGYRALNREELEELALSIVENVKDRGPFFSIADFVNRAVELRSAEMRRMGTDDGYNAYDYSNDFWEDPYGDSSQIKNNIDEINSKNSFYLRQDHMQKGVLQAAIDLSSINQAFFDDAYLIDFNDSNHSLNSKYTRIGESTDWFLAYSTHGVPRNYTVETIQSFWDTLGDTRDVWENYKAAIGSSLAGAPTYLTQADILKQIGSFITVRGDTFKIRAYGEVRNPLSDEIESKAWCEMLVQRYPEYMDPSINSPVDVNNRESELGYQGGRQEYDTLLLQLEESQVNKYLGRRFKILSFRWLSEREI